MKTILFSTAAAAAMLSLLPLAGQAQTVIAQDNASDAAYVNGTGNSYGTGSNGGFGFTPYTITAVGNSGTFIYTAAESEGDSGTPAPGSIDSPATTPGGSTLSFGLYAQTPADAVNISRGFTTGLDSGDTFALDFVTGYNDGVDSSGNAGAGNVGVALTSGTDTVGSFQYHSGNVYTFDGAAIAGQNYTTGALHLLYTLDSPTSYTLNVSGAFDYTGTGTFTTPITGFQVSQTNSGANTPDHNAYFNNLVETAPAAVPEASSSISLGLLMVLGLGGVIIARKRKAGSVA